jgi:hypothetical protein
MTREQLEHIIRVSATIADDVEIVVMVQIPSMAVGRS